MLLNSCKMSWGVPLFSFFLIGCVAVPLEEIVEAAEGHTVKLPCGSKDGNHTFAFWELASKNILGPGNEYNDNKYDYDVLSGLLYVRNISPDEEGTYTCFARDPDVPSKLKGRSVRMIVLKNWALHDQDDKTVNVAGILLLIGCALILIGGGVLLYSKWTREHRLQSLLLEEDEEEEDDSGEDVFIAPGPSKSSPKIVIDRSKSDESLDTDFGSILSSANK